MTKEEVRKTVQKELFVLQDLKYRDFHAKTDPFCRQGESDRNQNSGTKGICKEIWKEKKKQSSFLKFYRIRLRRK